MKERGYKKGSKVFWGIFLILGAVFLVVSRMGYLQGVGIVGILFSLFFLAIMLQGIWERSFGKILFPLACLCIIFDEPLGITAITPWTVLIAASLGTAGLNLIFKRKHSHIYKWDWREQAVDEEKYVDLGENFEMPERSEEHVQSGRKIFFRTNFSSAVKYVNIDCFEYASLECSFGGMKVFFDNAQIPGGNATIDLSVSFGGVELYIPKEWYVNNQTDCVCGSVDEKNHNRSSGCPMVTLTGDVSFSGVTIIYI